MGADIATLTRLINNEIIKAMGLPTESWIGRRLQPVFARATTHFSQLFVTTDDIIAREGLTAGARWLLRNFVRDTMIRGAQDIPTTGPLVIAANHPGTIDSVTIIANAGREDLKVIASDVPFLKSLSVASQHLIFLPRQGVQARMVVVREAIRHLREGGTLLLFARGGIDPDPSFMANAEQELARWSRSLEIFLRSVPRTRVVTAIVSHVLDPAYMRHPFTWLQRKRPDRQRLAMMLQVLQQMLGKKLDLVPHVSFGKPIEVGEGIETAASLSRIVESERSLLHSHLAWRT